MPFDGVQYERLALSPPVHGHPNAPAVGDAFHDGLTGAYMYARKQAQYMGCTTYRQFLRNRFAQTTLPGQFASTTWVSVGHVESFVPGHATHIAATAYFRVLTSEPCIAHGRINTASAGAGPAVVLEVPPFADTANVPVSGRLAAGSRMASFVPYFYDLHRLAVDVAIADLTFSPPGRGTFDMELYAIGQSGQAAFVKPEYVTFHWWAQD